MCKQIHVLRAYNQFVPSNFRFFVRNHSSVLVIACTLIFGSISIDTNFDERDRFLSKNTATGFSKKTICRETETLQKHLRPLY